MIIPEDYSGDKMEGLTQQTDTYIKNMQIIEREHPALALKLKNHQDTLELKIEAGVLLENRGNEWLPFHLVELYCQENVFMEMNKHLADIKRHRGTGFIFYGLDAGLRPGYIFTFSDNSFPIFVLERYIEIFKAVLSAFDWQMILESKRVFFFFGEDAANELEDFLQADNYFNALPTGSALFCRDNDGDYYLRAARRIVSVLNGAFKEELVNREKVFCYYRDLTRENLLDLFSPAHRKGLKVFGALSTNSKLVQYVTRDCMEAFQRLGQQTVMMESIGWIPPSALYKMLSRFLPQLYLAVNHLSIHVSENLITVTWITDPIPNLFNSQRKVEDMINKYGRSEWHLGLLSQFRPCL